MSDHYFGFTSKNEMTLWARIVLAAAIVIATVMLRFAIAPVTHGIPYILFFPAVLAVFFLCGLHIGLVASLSSAVLVMYFFSPPYSGWSFASFELINAGIFVSTTSFMGLLVTTFQSQLVSSNIAATAFETKHGMEVTDEQGTILKVNDAFTRITGYKAEEVIGKNPRILQSGRQNSEFFKGMWEQVKQNGFWEGEIWNRRKNGEIFPASRSISAVKNMHGEVTHYVGAFTDISDNKNAETRIEALAFYDPLTGLPNRVLLHDRLKHALVTCPRRQQQSALLHIDLDNFKTINDTLGHDQGDLIIEEASKRLLQCARASDTLARVGGDAFVLLLEGSKQDDSDLGNQARIIAEKILNILRQPYKLGESIHYSSASIGITLLGGPDQKSIEEPLKQAELAMYEAKAAGRGTLCFFDPKMQAQVNIRASLDSRMREAVDGNQFVLHFQPQVDEQAHITGAEALVRWMDPKRGLISPVDFIPAAESNGLILPIGQWVMETACSVLARWANEPSMAHMTMAVNVSAVQFRQSDFVEQVMQTLTRTGANPCLLKLELTESMLVDDILKVIAKMSALQRIGVKFSLDDFGTGYSSLSYLKRLPLDQLKIDQGFVRDILIDQNDAAIANTVIALAHSMGLNVIAEGVETHGQRDFLHGAGCMAYQGFLFGKPLPLTEFEAAANCA